jgi:hypothetical protein
MGRLCDYMCRMRSMNGRTSRIGMRGGLGGWLLILGSDQPVALAVLQEVSFEAGANVMSWTLLLCGKLAARQARMSSAACSCSTLESVWRGRCECRQRDAIAAERHLGRQVQFRSAGRSCCRMCLAGRCHPVCRARCHPVSAVSTVLISLVFKWWVPGRFHGRLWSHVGDLELRMTCMALEGSAIIPRKVPEYSAPGTDERGSGMDEPLMSGQADDHDIVHCSDPELQILRIHWQDC